MWSALGVPTPYASPSPKAHTQQGPCSPACHQPPGMSWGHHRPVHPSVPTFSLPSPYWSPQGPVVLSHSEPAYGPGRALQHQQRGEPQWTPLMPWTLPPQSLASLDPQPAQPRSIGLWPPSSPRRIASRPLGMLEPPKLGRSAVWCRRGRKLSHPPASPKATPPVCCWRSQGQPQGLLLTEMMVSVSCGQPSPLGGEGQS